MLIRRISLRISKIPAIYGIRVQKKNEVKNLYFIEYTN